MGKRSVVQVARGLRGKANAGAGPARPVEQKQSKGALRSKPGLVKDAAGSFLKQRMSMKLRDLRPRYEPSEGEALQSMEQDAQQKGADFDHDVQSMIDAAPALTEAGAGNQAREAENTRKRFYVELRKVLAAADVVIEVLDARDPMACRSLELEKEVTGSGKRLILVMNKIDLVPKHVVEAWTKHLKRSFPTLAFKAAHGGAKRPVHANTNAANAPDGLLMSTHAVVGADELMQLLKNYSRLKDGGKMKGQVTVGIVGYPNTGKSSIINSMKRHCAVETGGRAGVTKHVQEIQLDSKVTLLDSPGIVFEGRSNDPSVVLRNVVRVESVDDPVAVVDAMLQKAPRDAVLKFYSLERDFELVGDFLIHVAQLRGKLKRGSGLDIPSAARSVISDWTTGKFKYFALPPEDSERANTTAIAETSEVVHSLSQALDIDALFADADGARPAVLGAPQEDEEDDDEEML